MCCLKSIMVGSVKLQTGQVRACSVDDWLPFEDFICLLAGSPSRPFIIAYWPKICCWSIDIVAGLMPFAVNRKNQKSMGHKSLNSYPENLESPLSAWFEELVGQAVLVPTCWSAGPTLAPKCTENGQEWACFSFLLSLLRCFHCRQCPKETGQLL